MAEERDPRFTKSPKTSSHNTNDDDEFEELEIIGEERGLGGIVKRVKRSRFVQKNPVLIQVLITILLVSVVAGFLGWYFGFLSHTSGSNVAQSLPVVVSVEPGPGVQTPQPSVATPPTQPGAATQQPTPVEQPGTVPKAEQPAAQNVDTSKPSFPEDVSKWKKEDFFRARRASEPKLLEAIVFLGETFRGSESVALGLGELLKPLTELQTNGSKANNEGSQPSAPEQTSAPPAPVASVDQGQAAKLIEAIITALGSNGTPAARKVFEQILSGELKTDDDKVAVEQVIKTLVLQASPENEAILIRVLAEPEVVRPARREGVWPAKELRQKTLEWVKPAASAELRTRLAEKLGENFTKLEASDPIVEFLLAADPLNFGAQTLIYQLKGLTEETRTRLEQQLLSYSSNALGLILGLHKEGEVAGATSKAELTLAANTAALFWSEKFYRPLDEKIATLNTLTLSPNIVLLACTIPQSENRKIVARLLRQHWTEGPQSLLTAGFPEQLVTDPALLVMIKAFLRSSTKPRSPVAGAASQPKPNNRPAQPRNRVLDKAAEAAEALQKKREQAEQADKDWSALLPKLVTIWCKRFQMAGLAKEIVAAESGTSNVHGGLKMPDEFAFAPNVKVVSEYHLVWPDNMATSLGKVKPGYLRIHYACLEETKKPRATVGYYARQAGVRLNAAESIEGNILWFNGLRTPDSEGRRRSVDVLMHKSNGSVFEALKDNMETDISTEILVIEIDDPIGRE